MSSKKPTWVSRAQAPLQALIRPAQWFIGMRVIRQSKDTWVFPDHAPEQVLDAYVSVIEAIAQGDNMPAGNIVQLNKVQRDRGFVQVFVYTKAEWLDILEAKATQLQSGSGTSLWIKGFSSGFLPTAIPLAPLINSALFFFPFSDGGVNAKRLKTIKAALTDKLSSS